MELIKCTYPIFSNKNPADRIVIPDYKSLTAFFHPVDLKNLNNLFSMKNIFPIIIYDASIFNSYSFLTSKYMEENLCWLRNAVEVFF